PFCRLGARQLSALKPQLDANNVRLIAIGLEEIGVEEFVEGKFFNGELYIDLKKQCYKDLGFRRLNFFSLFPAIFAKKARDAMSQAKTDKIEGNFKGDGMQNGGTMVVAKGGKVLLNFKQDNPADHVDPNEVLKALGIEGTVDVEKLVSTEGEGTQVTADGEGASGVTCKDDVCEMPKKDKPKPQVQCKDDVCQMK
ncbi:prostamide/prostaglandin F synthase-like, partial [Haliotis rufescens]|uniref:prostamide/prostaglandin F synthase-like n=1 Tax=Haliotis rufescens TaxID=6454 RepID=UPI00201F41F7